MLAKRRNVVGFKAGEGRIEHFPPGDNDDIESGRDLVAPEHFPRQALGAIAFDGRSQLPRRRDAEARVRQTILRDEQRQEPAVKPRAGRIGPFEVGPPLNPFRGPEALPARR